LARNLAPPAFGLEEEIEGVCQSFGANDTSGVVLELLYRRKTGREMGETYFLASPRSGDRIVLLDDHPLFRPKVSEEENGESEVEGEVSFNLKLTEEQKEARKGVMLPFYDAQRGGEIGSGGRILYDMGSEDDFDEEEDEI
jgi:elongator complex protein 5